MLVWLFSLILVHRCARGGNFFAGYMTLENLSTLLIISKHKGFSRRSLVRGTLRHWQHWRLKIHTKLLRRPRQSNYSSSLHLLQWRAKIMIIVPDISMFTDNPEKETSDCKRDSFQTEHEASLRCSFA